MVGRGVEGVCREGPVTGWRGRGGEWGCYTQGSGSNIDHAVYHTWSNAASHSSHDGIHCRLQAVKAIHACCSMAVLCSMCIGMTYSPQPQPNMHCTLLIAIVRHDALGAQNHEQHNLKQAYCVTQPRDADVPQN